MALITRDSHVTLLVTRPALVLMDVCPRRKHLSGKSVLSRRYPRYFKFNVKQITRRQLTRQCPAQGGIVRRNTLEEKNTFLAEKNEKN